MIDVVNKIKGKIEEKRISQRQLAKMIEVSQVTVNSVLAKKTKIKVEMLQKIADVLNVPICYFFNEKNENADADRLLSILKKFIDFDAAYVLGINDFAERGKSDKDFSGSKKINEVAEFVLSSGRLLKYSNLTEKELVLLLKSGYLSKEILLLIEEYEGTDEDEEDDDE